MLQQENTEQSFSSCVKKMVVVFTEATGQASGNAGYSNYFPSCVALTWRCLYMFLKACSFIHTNEVVLALRKLTISTTSTMASIRR